MTVEAILELLKSLATLGASQAVQEVVLTWLRERNGVAQSVIDAALAKAHKEPPPTHRKGAGNGRP